MYYSSRKSNLFHDESCQYVRNIRPDNRRIFTCEEEASELGLLFCPACSRIMKRFRSEKSIKTYLANHKITVSFNKLDGALDIKSPHEDWKLYLSEESRFELYHKNSLEVASSTTVPGYHKQQKDCRTIKAYLQYINVHQSHRLNNQIMFPDGNAAKLYFEHEGNYYEKDLKHKPRKGTKRYRAEQRRKKEKEKRHSVRIVLDTLDSLKGEEGDLL